MRLRERGQAYRHPWMLLSLLPNNLTHNRYGFITNKHLGKAVVRNRVRRILREVIHKLHSRLEPGFDFVIVARPDLVGKPFAAAERIVEELCDRAGVIVEKQPHENISIGFDSLL